jgi:hypothetical protein
MHLPDTCLTSRACPVQFGHHPLFKRMWSVDVRANPVVRRAGEVAEDIRDRYETLDHPVVHKVEVSGEDGGRCTLQTVCCCAWHLVCCYAQHG